jgi:hypothetical protein
MWTQGALASVRSRASDRSWQWPSSRLSATGLPSVRGETSAAWPGVVPRQYSTGGKAKLLGISKRGNVYLCKVLIHGARAAVLRIKRDRAAIGPWLDRLDARAPKTLLHRADLTYCSPARTSTHLEQDHADLLANPIPRINRRASRQRLPMARKG